MFLHYPVASHRARQKEALKNIKEAIELYLETSDLDLKKEKGKKVETATVEIA